MRQKREAQGHISPTKALRRAFARAADEQWDLALVAQGVGRERYEQEVCVGRLEADDLLVLLEGPDGRLGLAAISRPVVMALVEVQTIGIVTPLSADTRAFTPTDAAMVAPLLDETFTGLETAAEEAEALRGLCGYRFGAMLDEPRTAGLVLEAPEFECFRLELDLAGGLKSGAITLCFPYDTQAQGAETEERDNQGAHHEALEQAPVEVGVSLPPLRLPIAVVRNLGVGERIAIPPDALRSAQVASKTGHVFARGRLGQFEGHWALRLDLPTAAKATEAPPEPEPEATKPAAPQVIQPLPEPEPLPELDDLPMMNEFEPLDALEPIDDLPMIASLPD